MIPFRELAGGKNARFLIRVYGIGTAIILWRARRRAGFSLESAARAAVIESSQLRRYEIGLESPPLQLIYALLTIYKANESTIFFFCTIPCPMPSFGQWVRMQFRRGSLLWAYGKTTTTLDWESKQTASWGR